MKLKQEIKKEINPKVLNVDKLKKEKVILTDSYSWKDFEKAIELTKEKIFEIIDKWNRVYMEEGYFEDSKGKKYFHRVDYGLIEELKKEISQ